VGKGASVEVKAAPGALTGLPILCDLLLCGMLVGSLARHKQSFQAAFKAGENK
jgi:hypothetical protein